MSPRELRRFGITVAIPLVLLAILWAWRGHVLLPAGLGGLAIGSGGLGLFAPRLLGPVHNVWMKIANAVGWFNTRLLLSLVYFLVMSPMGVVMRLLGHDPLDRRLRERSTYWVDHEPQPDVRGAMERRF